jgi:hypothetical protein
MPGIFRGKYPPVVPKFPASPTVQALGQTPQSTATRGVAPPVYRPNNGLPGPGTAQLSPRPKSGAPPVYRPEATKIAQRKVVTATPIQTTTKAPPMYRPQPYPVNIKPSHAVQLKSRPVAPLARNVVQPTMKDLLYAKHYMAQLRNELPVALESMDALLKSISNEYVLTANARDASFGINEAHPVEAVESGSQSLHHDAKEMLTHAAGYFYQAAVRHELHQTRLFSQVTGGLSNKTDPDIAATLLSGQKLAAEIKTTAGDSVNASIATAVTQLVSRRGYSEGLIVVRTTDYDISIGHGVDNLKRAAEQKFSGSLGTQGRALKSRDFNRIETRLTGHDGAILWKGIYAVNKMDGSVKLT